MTTVSLGDLFEFARNTKHPASRGITDGAYPFFLSSQDKVLTTNNPDIEGPALIFGNGGSASVHCVEGPFSASNHCYIAFPKNRQVDEVRFYNHYLKSNIHLLEAGFKGVGLKNISKSYLSSLSLPDASDTTKRRAVAILDKAEGIRRKRKQIIELTDSLLKSVFVEMFGDPVKNPNNFKIDKIQNHLSNQRNGVQSGPFGASLKKYEYLSRGVPVWGIDNIQINSFVNEPKLFISDEKFEQLHRYHVLTGDILISRAGTVGRMCVARPTVSRSIIGTNLVRVVFNPESLLGEYFVALFTYLPHRLTTLAANSKEKAFSFLNPKILRSLEIPIPPLSLQIEYQLRSKKVESFQQTSNRHLNALEMMSTSISHHALGGE